MHGGESAQPSSRQSTSPSPSLSAVSWTKVAFTARALAITSARLADGYQRPPRRADLVYQTYGHGATPEAIREGHQGRLEVLADWDGWVCSRDTAAEAYDKLSLTTPAAELRGLTFEELAGRIANDENGDMKEWKEWHKDNVGEDPKARWTKAQIIQSVLNDLNLP